MAGAGPRPAAPGRARNRVARRPSRRWVLQCAVSGQNIRALALVLLHDAEVDDDGRDNDEDEEQAAGGGGEEERRDLDGVAGGGDQGRHRLRVTTHEHGECAVSTF
eukprot:scaffold81613_cov64-Phaeocystis_antarctica.AAC.5